MHRACFLLVLLSQAIESQAIQGGQPTVRVFTTEDGLVRNWIQRIRTDSRGDLWFCTVEGISIFDGSRFTNFTIRDGVPSRLVNDVLEASNGEYWATEGGLSRFLRMAPSGGGHFENFTVGSDPIANRVQTLLEDSEHVLWLGTDGGLYRMRLSDGRPAFEAVSLDRGAAPGVTAIVEDSAHRIWTGDWTEYRFVRRMGGPGAWGSGRACRWRFRRWCWMGESCGLAERAWPR